ncbi:MAG TPA: LegC family aminotransferase [Paenibacillus sp.]|nr:LegC family aminotransferase [Paenibacillus sp.]
MPTRSLAALPGEVVSALQTTFPKKSADVFVPLHEPVFAGNEEAYVVDCIRTGWVSSVGSYVDALERKLEEYTGAKHAIAVVNGTAALHIALLLAGAAEADEVLIPALTFVATANAVSYLGAVPHMVDVESTSLGVDGAKLADYLKDIALVKERACYNQITGRRIHSLVAMHAFGHPADLDVLREVCERFQLKLIEDAAESLGSFYKGRHTGTYGDIAALSFNGNKIVTTGGGGAILTNNEEVGKMAKHLTTTAKLKHRWEYAHDTTGYNYRMPNLNAALGCAQLENLPAFLESKRALYHLYKDAFDRIPEVSVLSEPTYAKSNYWLQSLLLSESASDYRDSILEATNDAGFMTRPVWKLMSDLPMYRNSPSMPLTVAKNIEKRLINIPSGPSVGRWSR